MADPISDALARLGAAFGNQRAAPEPSLGGSSGLPDIDSLLSQANSGLPSFSSNSSSGLPTFGGNSSSGFASFDVPESYDRGTAALTSHLAQRQADLRATQLDPAIAAFSMGLGSRQAKMRAAQIAAKQTPTTSPDTLTEPMLAESPPNVAR